MQKNFFHIVSLLKKSPGRRIFLQLFFLLIFSLPGVSQSPNQIINTVNQHFIAVKDYSARVNIACDIPFIKIDPINAKVVYKKPDKFKVKASGILILPKQQANFFLVTLADTNSYTAVKTGEEIINNLETQVINIIPAKDSGDLILGKFWIDDMKGLVMKSQLTTRSQGTILIENTYGAASSFGLPDKMIFTVDVDKFKIPKAIAVDINRSSSEIKNTAQSKKGKITLNFSDYVVNKGVNNEEFK